MPRLVFLTERRPLVGKIADWLAAFREGSPLDLSDIALVVPTSGAGRRLEEQLIQRTAERGTGVLLPFFGTPLSLIDEAIASEVATRQECLLAWTRALAGESETATDLLPGFSSPLSRQDSLRVADSLLEVCALLAEAGLTPLSEEVLRLLPHDEERWMRIAAIYRPYLDELARLHRADPNEIRIKAAEEGMPPPTLRHVIVANAPDLNGLSRKYLAHLEQSGVEVTVLIDAVDCENARFDEWGGPEEEYWSTALLPLPSTDIAVAADAFSEAEMAAELCIRTAGTALCLADERLVHSVRNSLARRGRDAFDPTGEPLATSAVAIVIDRWVHFCTSQLVTDLQILMECPVFLGLLSRETGLVPTALPASFDKLRSDTLIDYWPDLAAYFRNAKEGTDAAVVCCIEKLRKGFSLDTPSESVLAFLHRLYEKISFPAGSREERSLRAYASILQSLGPALPGKESRIGWDLLRDAVAQTILYSLRQENDLDLNGWLEAAWLAEDNLIITGCAEDVLPASTAGHPFLPDTARKLFGLSTNASRLARDSFLLHNLIASRAPGTVKMICARQTVEGEPAKPSRLLFRCPEEDLAGRVGTLFHRVPSRRSSPARCREWRLQVPRQAPPAQLRVTGFGDYLTCPMRFYFKHVLRLESLATDVLEMDAREFGTVFHLVVEAFANEEAVSDSGDAAVIEKFVAAHLDKIIFARHGRRPSLPVRVQQESLRARLRQFALLQAAERAAGWQIEHAEYRFLAEDTLQLGGLTITASLDRVEKHEVTGRRRILDYKTFARDKSPAQVHLDTRAPDPAMPGEEVFWDGKIRYWKNLQLPLYRALAEHRWPGEEPPLLGYFLLPERLEDSRVEEFPLDDFTNHAALRCAEALAERVRRGIFWPPRTVEFDDFEAIFIGEDPADVLDEASIQFLSGEGSPP